MNFEMYIHKKYLMLMLGLVLEHVEISIIQKRMVHFWFSSHENQMYVLFRYTYDT